MINTDKICTTYNIFDTESFCEKFMQCTNLQADVNDAYPHSVCIDCYAKVLDFYQFRVMCHETLDKFNILLDSRGAKNCEIFSEGNLQTFDNKTVSVPPDVEIVDSLLTEEKCDNQPQTLDASVNDLEETPGDDPLAEHLDTDINLEEHCTKSITTKSTKTRQKTPKRRIAKIEIKKPKAEVVADEEYLTESSDDRVSYNCK